MQQVVHFYKKYQKVIENVLLTLALVLYPLLKINRGIDVSDPTYSLANFQYFSSMDGTWSVATYLANLVGSMLMHLPFGGTLPGMNCYTALIQSAMAVVVYFALKKEIPAPLVFFGEMMALGLCWCPSVILYHYLTYLFMTVGVLLLYRGILSKTPEKYYLAAGIFLGANVAVRMPNVVQAAFIVAVWYGAVLRSRKECGQDGLKGIVRKCCKDTFWCVLGYLTGFGIPFLTIVLKYGLRAYPDMVRTMFAMTDKAVDYKPAAMLSGMFGDYAVGVYWLFFAAPCIAGGILLFWVQRKWFPKNRVIQAGSKAGYVLLLILLLRFYWGRGMFHFYYFSYGSIYYPAVLLLLVAIFFAVFCLVKKTSQAKENDTSVTEIAGNRQKVLALLVLIQIFVTPLGSNNILYPIINNLFFVIPFLLWSAYSLFREKKTGFAFQAPLVILLLLVFVQSVGFHARFTFEKDSMLWGERLDREMKYPVKAAGILTTKRQEETLSELAVYIKEEELTGKAAVFYGDVPGLGYLLDMPSALSTFWLDLDSYRMEEFERDMRRIETETIEKKGEYPVIIASANGALSLSGRTEKTAAAKESPAAQKCERLQKFLKTYGYEAAFDNSRSENHSDGIDRSAGYVVYRHCKEK